MSFRRVDLHLPSDLACEVAGFLYTCDDPRDLGQDMIEVRLPNGVRINAGWYPEGGSEGCYRISVAGARQLPLVEHRDVDVVAREIESLIGQLSTPPEQAAEVVKQGLGR